MSRVVHILILSCGDMSREVRMFCAHTSEMLRAGRFVASGSRVLDYGQGGPYSWTMCEEVRRGRTTFWERHVNKCDFIISFILYYLKIVISDLNVTTTNERDK